MCANCSFFHWDFGLQLCPVSASLCDERPSQVPNHWESIGVAYLTYYWIVLASGSITSQRSADAMFARMLTAKSSSISVRIPDHITHS